LALGHLRISPNEWKGWTLREFDLAYNAWSKVNIVEPWERARAISFYVLKPYDTKKSLTKWEDVFQIASDKKKKKPTIHIRKMTQEERAEFEQITGEKASA